VDNEGCRGEEGGCRRGRSCHEGPTTVPLLGHADRRAPDNDDIHYHFDGNGTLLFSTSPATTIKHVTSTPPLTTSCLPEITLGSHSVTSPFSYAMDSNRCNCFKVRSDLGPTGNGCSSAEYLLSLPRCCFPNDEPRSVCLGDSDSCEPRSVCAGHSVGDSHPCEPRSVCAGDSHLCGNAGKTQSFRDFRHATLSNETRFAHSTFDMWPTRNCRRPDGLHAQYLIDKQQISV